MATKRYDKKFKEDAVSYFKEHEELSLKKAAKNLGISCSALNAWVKEAEETGIITVRGSGNYSSDEAKESARLRKELKDTQDALEIF